MRVSLLMGRDAHDALEEFSEMVWAHANAPTKPRQGGPLLRGALDLLTDAPDNLELWVRRWVEVGLAPFAWVESGVFRQLGRWKKTTWLRRARRLPHDERP